jgi:hypothetical protein
MTTSDNPTPDAVHGMIIDPAAPSPMIIDPVASSSSGDQLTSSGDQLAPPIAGTVVAPTDAPSTPVEVDQGSGDGGVREKAASVMSAATSFAKKVRREAPKKVQELKEQRASGRHVLLAERAGRTVAVGPYRDAETAQRSASKVTGANQIIELVSEAAFFAPEGGESSVAS